MKSRLPKVLHTICGKPILSYILDTAKKLTNKKILLVVGHGRDKVIETFKDDSVEFVIQDPPIGTGDAVLRCKEYLGDDDEEILILVGDAPLLKKETLEELINVHHENNADATILTAELPDPGKYGRIIRRSNLVERIVEAADATEDELKIKEINSGIYVFDKEKLFWALAQIKPNNVQGEYYLTDTIEILQNSNGKICAMLAKDYKEITGINTRETLGEVEKIIQRKIIKKHQLNGVTIVNPETVRIDYDVAIGKDTIIHQGVSIRGRTKIGSSCSIGENTTIVDSEIGDNVNIGANSYISCTKIGILDIKK